MNNHSAKPKLADNRGAFFTSKSIQFKLIMLVILVFSIVSTLGFSIIGILDSERLHNQLIASSKENNKLLSQDFVKIIVFGHPGLAIDITSRLRTLHTIEYLYLFNKDHKPVYGYHKEGLNQPFLKPDSWDEHYQFSEDALKLLVPLTYKNTHYGFIQSQVSTEIINQSRTFYLQLGMVYLLSLALATFALSWLIQRFFARPILELVSALKYITKTHDFSKPLTIERDDEIGELFHGFNVMQDAIEKANKELNDQKFALDNHAIVAVTNKTGSITYANRKFCDVSGYTRQELIGKDHRLIQSGLHDKTFYRKMYQTIEAGNVWNGDICNRAKDGHLYWVNTTIAPIKDANNNIIRYIVIRTDISKLKQAEKRYKTSEERMDLAMSVAQDGIWDCIMSEGAAFCDARYYTMLGYTPNEFVVTQEKFDSLIHPADLPQVREAMKKYLSGETEKYDIESRLKHKKGHYIWIRSRGKIVEYSEKGEPIRFVGTHSDITAAKDIEKSLRHAQKMDAIGKLTGGVAHEFNNILSIILGNLELLEQKLTLDSVSRNQFDAISQSANRAADLTKQLLNFSHNQHSQPVVVNLNDEIHSIDNMIRRSITAQIKLVHKLDKNLWSTRIDIGDLQATILNLVINASHAIDGQGSITIETTNAVLEDDYCKLYSDVKKGDYVQLSITDDGEGMSSEIIEQIFEPFFTTKPQGKGTGLGLAMVFSFAKSSGGFIVVGSELKKGTQFKLYLPRTQYEKKLTADPTILDDLTTQGNETVLIVEDELQLLEFATEVLQQEGYQTLTAKSADAALKILAQENAIDLLFSDVLMPGTIDGYELAKLVAEKYPKIKILLTSGYNDYANDKQSGFFVNILDKPYTLKELKRRVRNSLNK